MNITATKRKLPESDPVPVKVTKRTWIALDDIERFVVSLNKVPPLEQIVLINVLTDVWKKQIKRMIDTRIVYNDTSLWLVSQRICKLSLPESVKENLQFYSSSIGNSIQNWMDHIHKDCAFTNAIEFNPKKYVNLIVWTVRGNVNYFETAKRLLQADIDVSIKFLIAGNYCMEEEAMLYKPSFQVKVIKDVRKHHADLFLAENKNQWYAQHLNVMLLRKLIRQERGTAEAFKFLWNKLTPDDQKSFVRDWLCVKFCTFSDFEPIKLFLQHTCELDTAYDYDLIDRILELLDGICEEKVWNYALSDIFAILREIPEEKLLKSTRFRQLARNVALSMRNEYQHDRILMGTYYLTVLKEFWSCISTDCRKVLLNSSGGSLNAILYFPWSRNRNFVFQLFDDMSAEKRVAALRLSFYNDRLTVCMLHENWKEFLTLIDTNLKSDQALKVKKRILLKILFDHSEWNDVLLVINRCWNLELDDFCEVVLLVKRMLTAKDDWIGIVTRLFVLRVEDMRRDGDDIVVELHRSMDVVSKSLSSKLFKKFTSKVIDFYSKNGPTIVNLIEIFPKKSSRLCTALDR